MKLPSRKLILKIFLGLISLAVLLLIVAYILIITHRKEILTKVTDAFHQRLTGELLIGDVDFTIFEEFPNFSIRLEDISVTDSLAAHHKYPLLTAKKISLRIDLLKLLQGSVQLNTIKITNASISLFKDKSGQMNTPRSRQVASVSTGKKTPAIPKMKKIFLENVSFKMTDSVMMKNFGVTLKDVTLEVTKMDSAVAYDMDGLIHFDGLVFNQEKGGYLTNQDVRLKALVAFNPHKKLLMLNQGALTIQKQKLTLTARINFTNKTLRLKFDTKSILPSVAYSILTPAISSKLNIYQLEKPVMARVVVVGSIAPGSQPAVDVYFKSSGNRLSLSTRSFDSLKVLGMFTNHIDSTKINDDHNSKVVMPVFSGTVYGFPISSEIVVTDLLDPTLFMRASVSYDCKLQGELITDHFKFFEGAVKINFLFNAPLINYIDTVNQRVIGKLMGDILIDHVSFNHLSTGYEFKNMTGHISFNRPNLTIDSIRVSVNGNEAKLTGYAENFVSFIFIASRTAYVNLNVTAGTVDFNLFKSPPAAADAAPKKAAVKKSNKNFVSSKMDWMAGSIELDMQLQADKILYKHFVATNISSTLALNNDFVKVSNAQMITSGGTFTMSGGITGLSNKQHQLNFQASVKGARINDLMYSFDNFNQQSITNKNVFGILNARATFAATMGNGYNIIGSTMRGNFSTYIKKGSLKGIDGLQNISKYIFKNRDFSDIQFADLHNKANIQGALLDIDTLNIFSSVLTLFIEGNYDFNNVNTDLLVTVPLSNLKKMDAKERMQQVDSVARSGRNLVLRAYNTTDGGIKIAPVIFGKKKREK